MRVPFADANASRSRIRGRTPESMISTEMGSPDRRNVSASSFALKLTTENPALIQDSTQERW